MRGNKMIAMCLPKTLHWSLHNIIGHPIMEVCHLTGDILKITLGRGESLKRLGSWVHDITVPAHIGED